MTNHTNIIRSIVLACAASTLALSAVAQTIYKQIGNDGRIVYTDKQDPERITEKKIQPTASNNGIGLQSTQNATKPARETDSGAIAAPATPGSPLVLPQLPPLPGAGAPLSRNPTVSEMKTMIEKDKKNLADQYGKERQARLNEAKDQYDLAVKKQEEGKTALPSERTPNVSGSSRFNQRYRERQEQLKRDVQMAKEAMDNASKN